MPNFCRFSRTFLCSSGVCPTLTMSILGIFRCRFLTFFFKSYWKIKKLTPLFCPYAEVITPKHYCSRNLWATYGEHMGSPYDPHMFPIYMGKVSKQPNRMWPHMLSNIWGNLWATLQHMGNIWGNVVIFAFKLALLNIWAAYWEHIGNIWGTCGKHMGNI